MHLGEISFSFFPFCFDEGAEQQHEHACMNLFSRGLHRNEYNGAVLNRHIQKPNNHTYFSFQTYNCFRLDKTQKMFCLLVFYIFEASRPEKWIFELNFQNWYMSLKFQKLGEHFLNCSVRKYLCLFLLILLYKHVSNYYLYLAPVHNRIVAWEWEYLFDFEKKSVNFRSLRFLSLSSRAVNPLLAS